MRINDKEVKGVEIRVVSRRLKPGLAGSRQIAMYEASCKVKSRTKKKQSENIGELLDWVKSIQPEEPPLGRQVENLS